MSETGKDCQKIFLERKKTAAWIVKLLLSPRPALAHSQLNKALISASDVNKSQASVTLPLAVCHSGK